MADHFVAQVLASRIHKDPGGFQGVASVLSEAYLDLLDVTRELHDLALDRMTLDDELTDLLERIP